jgi:hypothetical protein
MKAFIGGLIFLVLVAVVGYFGLMYYQKNHAAPQVYKTEAITRVGTVQKSSVKGVDYAHIIVGTNGSWGVMSNAVNLDQYVGKKVEATGQNSGSTLYIDTIKEVQ